MVKIHPLSDVNSVFIGEGTRVWQYSVIFEGAIIGKDCNICAHTMIESKTILGDRVTIKSGVYIWDNTIIEDDVFIGPCVAFTNDKYPRSKNYHKEFPTTKIKKGASIGANATLLPGITIGENSMIGAGSVVTKDIPDNVIAYGNPAKIIGFIKK